jgi:hypothetical protein
MGAQQVRIGIRGRISDATATTLGGRIEAGDDGFELVVPYIDQAQVTGLLVRLGDLHIPFHLVAMSPSATTTDTPTDESTGAPS